MAVMMGQGMIVKNTSLAVYDDVHLALGYMIAERQFYCAPLGR